MAVNADGVEFEVNEWRSLINQLKEIYEEELKKIDDELGNDGKDLKIGVT